MSKCSVILVNLLSLSDTIIDKREKKNANLISKKQKIVIMQYRIIVTVIVTMLVVTVQTQCPADVKGNCTCESSAQKYTLYCPSIFNYNYTISYTKEFVFQIDCSLDHRSLDQLELLPQNSFNFGSAFYAQFKLCQFPKYSFKRFLHIFNVTNVQSIFVYGNQKRQLNSQHFSGYELKEIKLRDCDIETLPNDMLSNQYEMVRLYINDNPKLSQIPSNFFKDTTKLEILSLGSNNIDHLSAGALQGLTNLTSLHLQHNKMAQMSEELLKDLNKLINLDLYSNEFTTFPENAFSSLHKLSIIKLTDNPLESLPENLFYHNSNLKQIDIVTRRSSNMTTLPVKLFAKQNQLTELKLQYIGLETLPDGLFDNATLLENVTLDHNALINISGGLFKNVPELKVLDLSYNKLNTIPDDLLKGTKKLVKLFLGHNQLKQLPDKILSDQNELKDFRLENNQLTSIKDDFFNNFPGKNKLEKLNLENNQLNLAANFDSLPETDLSSSQISRSSLRHLTGLKTLLLKNNRINRIYQDWKHLMTYLELLDLSNNSITDIEFSDLNFLTENAIIDLSSNQISSIQLYGSLTLVEDNTRINPNRFILNNNPLRCDCFAYDLIEFVQKRGLYKRGNNNTNKLNRLIQLDTDRLECKKLLDPSGKPIVNGQMSVQKVDPINSVCMFSDDPACPDECACSIQPETKSTNVFCENKTDRRFPSSLPPDNKRFWLTKTTLNVQNNKLRKVPNLIRKYKGTTIKSLDLSRNNISSINHTYLPTSLETLNLSYNNFSNFDQDLLDWFASRMNFSVSLGKNPLKCDCFLKPLFNYMQANYKQIIDINDVRCTDTNTTVFNMLVEDLCPAVTATVIVISVVCLLLVMILCVAIVLYYNYSETIKVWLYAHNMCLWFVTEEELDADKTYDAFISYSHKDEEFIVQQLVPRLENEEPRYKLCLHFRDWIAGEWIPDQVINSVKDARRTIVVLSKHFIESEWGRMEFRAAHQQAMNDKRNRIIIVVYGDVPDTNQMDDELKMYVQLNTYLKWDDALFWDRLRYALPHKKDQLQSSTSKALRKKKRMRKPSDKLGLIVENGNSATSTPATTPTIEIPMKTGGQNGHLNIGLTINEKLQTIPESRKLEKIENIV